MRSFIFWCLLPAVACSPFTAEAAKQADPRSVQWFQNAKFGLFVHWGVYSVVSLDDGEQEMNHRKTSVAEYDGAWVMHHRKTSVAEYEKLPPKFNPVKFDAAEWVSMVKGAGMKYITITAKHHDGFAMYDSKVSDYDIVDRTPYKKDVLAMLADECEKQGVKLFFYYSPLDWHHPDYFPHGATCRHSGRPESGDWAKYKKYYMAQIDELCSGRYGNIGGIWLDGIWDKPKADWGLAECYDRIHTAQPQALIGNNHHVKPLPGEDFQIFEQDLPGANTAGCNKAQMTAMPLESCMTISRSWGYKAADKDFKSTKECLHYLIGSAGRGANLLLNVGPRPDGTIQPEAKIRLAEIGAWLKKHGESIYGTRRGPYSLSDWGVSTIKGDDTVYLHILKFPSDGKLSLAAPPDGVLSVATLDGTKLSSVQVTGGKLRITIPGNLKNDIDTILVLKTAADVADPKEIHRTKPDLIVYDPTGGEVRAWKDVPRWNEHFLVQETHDGNLLGTWTSTSASVGYSRSEDGGKTWTTPVRFKEKAAWQIPLIAPSGRIYLFSTHGGFSGGLSCRISDDHGRTWGEPVELPFPKTELDGGTPSWISCTVPHWDAQGRPLIAYTHWASSDAVPGGTAGIKRRYCHVESFRIDNIKDDPKPKELKFIWLNRDTPVTVPHESIEGASFAQEPYVVDLPDGRIFMAVRTNRGEAWYTVSDDQGETWRKTEPMRYRDGGEIIKQPASPAAVFKFKRGDYMYLFNNNDGYVFGATSRWDVRNRRPAYISRGEFRPKAHQPIWWSAPKLIVDNQGVPWRLRLDAATYTSMTEHQGRRVLWYPDRKGFLLGKYITDEWLDELNVPQ